MTFRVEEATKLTRDNRRDHAALEATIAAVDADPAIRKACTRRPRL